MIIPCKLLVQKPHLGVYELACAVFKLSTLNDFSSQPVRNGFIQLGVVTCHSLIHVAAPLLPILSKFMSLEYPCNRFALILPHV